MGWTCPPQSTPWQRLWIQHSKQLAAVNVLKQILWRRIGWTWTRLSIQLDGINDVYKRHFKDDCIGYIYIYIRRGDRTHRRPARIIQPYSPGGVAIRYLLPVLRMASRFYIMVLWRVVCISRLKAIDHATDSQNSNQILLNDKEQKCSLWVAHRGRSLRSMIALSSWWRWSVVSAGDCTVLTSGHRHDISPPPPPASKRLISTSWLQYVSSPLLIRTISSIDRI